MVISYEKMVRKFQLWYLGFFEKKWENALILHAWPWKEKIWSLFSQTLKVEDSDMVSLFSFELKYIYLIDFQDSRYRNLDLWILKITIQSYLGKYAYAVDFLIQ